ncbi:MAG: response regulator [Candidatus Saccharibacteria bacterium]
MAGLRKILLVEDDVMIRDLYRIALVDKQYSVEVARDALGAYEIIKAYHPDCILLDIMLPGVSGLEILKELRTNPVYGCQNTKILVVTNLAQRSATENALANGADGYIIKADILPKDLPAVITSLEKE